MLVRLLRLVFVSTVRPINWIQSTSACTLFVAAQGGRVCTIRNSRGDDEMAACGQLGSGPELAFRPPPILEPPPRFKALLEEQQRERQQMQQVATA